MTDKLREILEKAWELSPEELQWLYEKLVESLDEDAEESEEDDE